MIHHTYQTGRLETWYEQNYTYLTALWPNWLSDTLKEVLDPTKAASILSPSANKGWHEKAAFHQLQCQGYQTSWLIGDYLGKTLYQHLIDEPNFRYHRVNQDAQYWPIETKFDIILDNKGALWYALRKWRCKKAVIALLHSYIALLKRPEAILLIDGYEHQSFSYWANLWRFRTLPSQMDRFYEHSTYSLLQQSFQGSKQYFHHLDVSKVSEETRESILKMNMVYITQTELLEFLHMLEPVYGSENQVVHT